MELIRQNIVKKTRLPRRVHFEEPPLVSLDEAEPAGCAAVFDCDPDLRFAEAGKRCGTYLLFRYGNAALSPQPA
jgi:hypothetical protein